LWQLKTLEIGHRLPRQAGDLRSLKDETVCGELSPYLSGRGHWSISTGRLRCYRWLTRSNHPAEAKEFARQELASEMKRDFSAEVLEQSWGRLHFVSEISREPFDHFLRMWRLAVCESGCNRVDLVGGVSKQAMQVAFDFKVPAEATQRFEDLVTQAQTDFVRWGASHFRILNVVSNPCDYRVEIIFSSELGFREFESDQGGKVFEAWKQTKDRAVQTEYALALIHYPSRRK
jgi:hypothetical protein